VAEAAAAWAAADASVKVVDCAFTVNLTRYMAMRNAHNSTADVRFK